MDCRYCHNPALKSYNDEPVCNACFDALTNRDRFLNDPRVYQPNKWHEPITKVISNKDFFKKIGVDENGRYPKKVKTYLPMERREEEPGYDINEENDPEYRLV